MVLIQDLNVFIFTRIMLKTYWLNLLKLLFFKEYKIMYHYN